MEACRAKALRADHPYRNDATHARKRMEATRYVAADGTDCVKSRRGPEDRPEDRRPRLSWQTGFQPVGTVHGRPEARLPSQPGRLFSAARGLFTQSGQEASTLSNPPSAIANPQFKAPASFSRRLRWNAFA